MDEILMINDERLGNESYIGIRSAFREIISESVWIEWFSDRREDEQGLDYEEYIEETLNQCLRPATPEEIACHQRI